MRADRSEYIKQWRKDNRDKVRASIERSKQKDPEKYREWDRQQHLKKRFGITSEEYDRLITVQEGRCAICQQACVSGRRLSIDHDHRTGQIRSLLCGRCNPGLGQFNEDPELLRTAADYLERHRLELSELA